MGAAFGKGTDRRTDARTQPRSERDAQKAGTADAPGPEDAPLGVGRGEGGVSSWQRREAAGASTEAATAVRAPGALVPRASPSAQPRFGRRRPPALRFRFRLASAPAARAAAMAYSTVQRVALASGLVLAVSLLLPKAFLSRGKRQEPPPAPEGEQTG